MTGPGNPSDAPAGGPSRDPADPPHRDPAHRDLAPLVERLARHPKLGEEVVYRTHLAPSPERFEDLDPPLPPELAQALAAHGVPRLWSHQARALAHARARRDVLVTTPTASGKSLVFQVPVLEEAAIAGTGRALFLFPLKALGQDQKGKLDRLAAAAGLPSAPADPHTAACRIYDGDTSRQDRAEIRRHPPRVLITNPDMLHLGILGHWTSWEPFLRDLQWIVLDELHTYRGIFGSHFHHVLQRLLRLAGRLGAEPSLVASSATAANAEEFAGALTGRRFQWVEESGAPREGRHLVLLRPETSPYSTTLDLFVELLKAGMKTIVFTKARRITELLYSWLRRREPELARRVASYRSGFLPEERRKIEADLFSGKLDGVVSTSALEMGIDVGGLDACILVGYPGSVMATWQRSGRVGRSGRDSLTALVALPDALDQYFLDHPDQLVARPCERLVVDPANAPIAREHLVCAAAEEALRPDGEDREYLAPYAAPDGELLAELVADGRLLEAADGAGLYSLARNPHSNVSLRGGGDTFAIVLPGERPRTIGTVDGVRVLHECHPGAVYLHRGRQYLVSDLDLEKHRAVAEREDVDYFTSPLTDKETEILEVLEERRDGPLSAWLGRVRVTERVVGYERRRIQGRELLSRHDLDLPPVRFETVALWWAAPRPAEETLRRAGRHFMGALHASEHAAISLFPLLALCDRNDVGGISYPRHPQVGCGAVFVYDGHPGGVGIAATGFRTLDDLLGRVAAMIEGCPCEDGCPSCIQSPKCGNGNRPLDKAGAIQVLHLLLGREEAAIPWGGPVELDLEKRPGWAREAAAREEEAEAAESAGGEAEAEREAEAGEREVEAEAENRAPDPGLRDGRSAASSVLVGDGESGEAEAGAMAPEAAPAGRRSARRPPASAGEVEAGAVAPGVAPAGRQSPSRPPTSAEEPGASPASRSTGSGDGQGAPQSSSAPTVLDLGAGPAARRRAAPRPPVIRVPPGGTTVLFDLETLRSAADVGGWGNAHRMGVAVGVACFLEEGRFRVYREDGVNDLVEALAAADLVVGFNVKRFDYRVLSGYTGVDYARRLPTLDLLEELHGCLGFRLGLGHLAKETLGTGKSADGLQSLRWVQEGRFDLVEDYCRRDVEVLRDLYLHGRREGCLYYRDRKRNVKLKICVEW